MKRIFLALIGIVAFCAAGNAQCGEPLMKQALAAMGSFQYIKDFDIKLAAGAADGMTFSVVLNSRTHYQVNIANGQDEKVTIQLMDGEGKMIGTNSNAGKVFPAFQFICSKTGAYKLKVSSASGSEACARAVLSLVKQYTEAEMP